MVREDFLNLEQTELAHQLKCNANSDYIIITESENKDFVGKVLIRILGEEPIKLKHKKTWTLALIAKWLEEKYQIHIDTRYNSFLKNYGVSSYSQKRKYFESSSVEMFTTRTDALSKAITETLIKLIKENGS